MTRLKRTAAVLAAFCIMLTGCGKSETGVTSDTTTSAPETTVTTTTTPAATTATTTTPETSATTATSESTTTETTTTTSAPETSATTTTTEQTTGKTEETTVTTTKQEISSEKKYIALTFDDGPNTTTTAEILDLLEEYDITASFFLIGQNITAASAPVVKRAYDMGCEINSHSYTHSDMTKFTADEIKDEMDKTAKLIYDIIGENPKFFRPPYIAINSELYEAVDIPFICGTGCNDWDPKVTAERRAMVITRKCDDGCIILLHDSQGNDGTVEALRTIIPFYLENGYEFVTVSGLFEAKGMTPSADKEVIYTYATESGYKE